MPKKYSPIIFLFIFLNIFFLLGLVYAPPAFASVSCEYTPRDSEGMTIGPGYPGYTEERRGSITAPWLRTLDSEEQCNTFCEAALRGCRENRPVHCDAGRSLCGIQPGGICVCCNAEQAVSTMSNDACNDFCRGRPEREGVKTFGGVSPTTSPCPIPVTTSAEPTFPSCNSNADCEQVFPGQGFTCRNNICEVPEWYKVKTPDLQIPIPGFLTNLSPATIYGEPGSRYFYIPWIGEYASAIYQYALTIVGILATVVLVWAGVVWLTAAGNAEKIKIAKEYIAGALIGLVLTFGSYLILYTLNPDLVKFDAFKLRVIERVTWDEVDTVAASLAAAEDGRGPIATSEQCDKTLANCSVNFSAEAQADTGTGPGNIRALEFFQKWQTAAASLPPGAARSKVIIIANSAANCCVILGSCGESNLRINFLAGVPEAIAGQRGIGKGEQLKNDLGLSYRGISRHELEKPQKEYLDTINCDGSIPNCSHGAQVRMAYERLRVEVGGGYPDTWAEELQIGDSMTIFNANSSVRGGHAAIFMGWTARDGVANVIQGSPGKVVKRGTLCLKSTCGTPFPFIATFKAEP
jgi:hypothetical protein